MPLLRRILLAAIPAGLIAGAALTAVQIPFVLPLIHQAEVYERQGDNGPTPSLTPESAPPSTPQEEETPSVPPHAHDSAPLLRFALTLLSNLLVGIAGGLLLSGAMALRGEAVGARRGLLWGLAAFAAFALAPALGLPPELPGSAAAGLGARQAWWAVTAAATASGMALVVFSARPAHTLLGCALLALPHVVGAPHPPSAPSLVPDALARQFVTASLLAAFVYWLVLGAAVGLLRARLDPDDATK